MTDKWVRFEHKCAQTPEIDLFVDASPIAAFAQTARPWVPLIALGFLGAACGARVVLELRNLQNEVSKHAAVIEMPCIPNARIRVL